MEEKTKKEGEFEGFGAIFAQKKRVNEKKPPAYQWQELALKIIKDLNVPNFKRSSIFKVCRDNSQEAIERSLNDTKELCKSGEKWKYFLKVIVSQGKPKE